MGWDFSTWANRQEMARYLLKNTELKRALTWDNRQQKSVDAGYFSKWTTISSKFVGTNLWAVVEIYKKFDNGKESTERHIALFLTQKKGNTYGYKDLDESVYPFYFDCPLEYLELASEVRSAEWREKVKEYHKLRKRAI